MCSFPHLVVMCATHLLYEAKTVKVNAKIKDRKKIIIKYFFNPQKHYFGGVLWIL